MTSTVTWTRESECLGRAVAAIGVFDGVHVGHQALIRDTVELARSRGVASAVVTFDRDPDQVVDPEHAAPQLLEVDSKLELIAGLGPDIVLLVPFDTAVAALSPREFLDDILLAAFDPEAVLVGYDFRFGRRAEGDLDTLLSFAAEHGFDVVPHPLVRVGGEPVTSTRVRALVCAGDVAGARELLGRPHRLRGEVVHGRGAGADLGARTANLALARFAARPADGVYAARVTIDGVTHAAGVSVGVPPTFPDGEDLVEVHVLGYEGDLYGRTLDIEFLARLRDQARFPTAEALAAAIREDLGRVAEVARDDGTR